MALRCPLAANGEKLNFESPSITKAPAEYRWLKVKKLMPISAALSCG
jgi:hypothetical protein